jgi:phosphate-selective porin OprO/OprP
VTTGSAPTATAAASAPIKDRVVLSDRPDTRVDGGNIESLNIDNVRNATYVGGEAAFVYKRFSVQAEYNRLHLDRFTGVDPTFDGYYVFGSVFLTGESRVFKGGVVDRVKPYNNFDPGKGHWGAFEVLARYDVLNLTDKSFSALGHRAESVTGALNWYLNPNVRFIFNYIRFKGENSPLVVAPVSVNGTTAKGDAFATRLQVDF